MDVISIRKAISLIARGLLEKEHLIQAAPNRYPHSKVLQHGINMFLYASIELGGVGDAVFEYADESHFLQKFIQLPISQWFKNWDPQVCKVLKLEEQPFYGYDAFTYPSNGNHRYRLSEECSAYLETLESNIIEGTDEYALYEKMTQLSQSEYCAVRRFLIECPILTIEDRRAFLLQFAHNPQVRDVIHFAYEQFEDVGYRCPACGWTLTIGKYGTICHSEYCTKPEPILEPSMKIDGTFEPVFRLKKGIMRYFAQPGKLELEIAKFCEAKKLNWTLWPQKDTYDVEITFSDGTVWEIDAKAYHNPIALRNKIVRDNGLPVGKYQRGFFVIPTEFTRGNRRYTAIVNQALDTLGQLNVRCVTMNQLKQRIHKKVVEIRE